MAKRLCLALLALVLVHPPALEAQSGTIRYERSITRTGAALAGQFQRGERGPEGRGGPPADGARQRPAGQLGAGRQAPRQEYAVLTLTFDGMVGLTRIEPLEEAATADRPAAGAAGGRGARAGALRQRLEAGLRARGLPGVPTRRTTAVWTDAATGEQIEQIDFMTRDFRVHHTPPPLAWKLLGEESEYLGYVVQKAVAERDSSTIEAWFTVDVPGFAAPEGYTGLPGVVLMVSVDKGETLIQAVNVDVGSPVDAPLAPTEGDEMTAEEFDALVAEKTEEFRAQMQSRRRGGGDGS